MTTVSTGLNAQEKLTQCSRWTLTGRAMSGIVAAFLLIDGVMKLVPLPVVRETLAGLGYPPELARTIGILTVVPAALYLWPRTAILGAILLTGLFGGAMATHLRFGSPLFTHTFFGAYLGVLVWGGLYLRNPKLRQLLHV